MKKLISTDLILGKQFSNVSQLRRFERLQAGLPFAIYPVFTAVDLFGIYQGLKHVHLQTLTKVGLMLVHCLTMSMLSWSQMPGSIINTYDTNDH